MAIHRAADEGFDLVEVDVQASADDEPVLFHDDWSGTLRVSCGVDRAVQELSLKELRAIRYVESDEHVASLEEALALCADLRLGIMLDFKVEPATARFLLNVLNLLQTFEMDRAAVTITYDPRIRAALGGRVLLRVQQEDADRATELTPGSLTGQFWFDLPADLPSERLEPLHRAGALVLPALNNFRYPPHAHRQLASADVARLQAAGVDGFQIDAEYRDLFM
jgi:glycerophosphoryl diester phosphodiesterase